MPVLALKVDVDTYQGMRDGLPRVVRVLERFNVAGSFFISFGPDRSGLAVLQLVRPRFLAKMIRTNAPGMYGLKTALYGTLLKAPMIGVRFPDAVRDLAVRGHEVACHAWDHRLWQDWLFLMSTRAITAWFDKMTGAYGRILGTVPASFGAPGWCLDNRALSVAGTCGFSYLSCSRAAEPFVWAENGLLEVPSNLPCIEEVGVDGVMEALGERSREIIPQVLPVHAEVEGTVYEKDFERIVTRALSLGYEVRTLGDIAARLDTTLLARRPLRRDYIHGRAFRCAV